MGLLYSQTFDWYSFLNWIFFFFFFFFFFYNLIIWLSILLYFLLTCSSVQRKLKGGGHGGHGGQRHCVCVGGGGEAKWGQATTTTTTTTHTKMSPPPPPPPQLKNLTCSARSHNLGWISVKTDSIDAAIKLDPHRPSDIAPHWVQKLKLMISMLSFKLATNHYCYRVQNLCTWIILKKIIIQRFFIIIQSLIPIVLPTLLLTQYYRIEISD